MEAHARVLHVCSSFTSHSPKVLYLSIKDLAATGDYFCVFVCLFFFIVFTILLSLTPVMFVFYPLDDC